MIHWNVDPEIFQLGSFAPRWYGLLFAAGFLIGYKIFEKILTNEKLPIAHADRLVTWIGLSTIIGARLGHVLFYEPQIYLAEPLRILKIWEGGLASHGAAIAIILSLWFYAKKYPQLSFSWLLDRVAIIGCLSGALIRLGNLMNSEIVGKPTDVPWAIVFERIDSLPRHPAQLYESLAYFLIFALIMHLYWKRDAGKAPLRIFGIYLFLVFSARFLIEFVKENQVAFESQMFLNMGQMLSIPAILMGVTLIIRSYKRAR